MLASGFDRYWQRLDLPPFGWMQSSCVGREGWISTPESRTALLVVHAQEERLIAQETAKVLA